MGRSALLNRTSREARSSVMNLPISPNGSAGWCVGVWIFLTLGSNVLIGPDHAAGLSPLRYFFAVAKSSSVRIAGKGDDRGNELKPFVAVQGVQLPPGKGPAGQPEASLARMWQHHARS